MPTRFLLYPNGSGPSARSIAGALDIPCGTDLNERVDYLIRWGSTKSIQYRPNVRTINKRDALSPNKYEQLVKLSRIQRCSFVPSFHTDWSVLANWPMLGRRLNHHGGTDIKLYMQPRDIELYGESDFYVRWLPKYAEYRVHVCNRRIIKVSQKVYDQSLGAYDPLVWNYRNGHSFSHIGPSNPDYARLIGNGLAAVQGLGLDFGAVDIIKDQYGLWVLEVNTAPGITTDSTLNAYVSELSRMLDL